jgi:vacuolar-type H+-ATPase subunit H
MNEPKSVINAQVEALLALVENYRESRCRQILEQARAQATEVVKQAHREARARMHKAIDEERARAQEKVASTHAQLQTRRRQRHHKADMALLETAWPALHETLVARWQDADSRRVWVRALVNQASTVLPAKQWRIEHPAGWQSRVALALAGEITAQAEGEPPVFVEACEATAGLRLCADGACLDGTPEGLLVGRAEIEAELLAEFHRVSAKALAAGEAVRVRTKTDS